MYKAKPDWVIVQGDTASAMAGALAAYYHGIPIVHVEAGLRTYEREPYPEEAIRRSIDVMADLLFAPTLPSALSLWLEQVPGSVYVVGNTVIDALLFALTKRPRLQYASSQPLILVTTHRRENWDHMADIAQAILKLSLSSNWEHCNFLWSAHPNLRVSGPIRQVVRGSRIVVRTAIDYVSWCHLMKEAHLIITDSGGIQEEAAFLGVPVMVLRKKTERPEGGAVIVDYTSQAEFELQAIKLRGWWTLPSTVFGDGTAAIKIVDILLNH
jgi:UDP-N-acetylglucosamine 2-epimerase (non-hydrolysing)